MHRRGSRKLFRSHAAKVFPDAGHQGEGIVICLLAIDSCKNAVYHNMPLIGLAGAVGYFDIAKLVGLKRFRYRGKGNVFRNLFESQFQFGVGGIVYRNPFNCIGAFVQIPHIDLVLLHFQAP